MYDDDPGAAYFMKAWSVSSDWFTRILRIILLCVALVGVIFSILVLRSCAFTEYNLPSDTDLDEVNNDDLKQFWNNGTFIDPFASFGLFRFNPSGLGCSDYDVPNDELPTAIRTSRFGGVLAFILGALAFLLLLIEFVCCRFWCSRVIIVFLMIFAGFCQLITFSMMGSNVCSPKGFVYLCELDEGATYTIVASALFLASSFLTCLTPKAIPLYRVMKDMEKNSIIDPCCCLPGRTRQEILEENDSLLVEEHLPDPIVEGVQGYEYKQYYDSKAGVTLQDQLKAAYTQWMNCEKGYDQTLDRFKSECTDADESWREIKKMDPEDIEDNDLSRLVLLLAAQRTQCERAKQDLDRFQLELDLATTPPEVRDVEMVEELMLVEGYDPDATEDASGPGRLWWMKPWKWRKRKGEPVAVEVEAMSEEGEKMVKEEGEVVKEGEDMAAPDAQDSATVDEILIVKAKDDMVEHD